MGQNFGPNPARGQYYPAAIQSSVFAGGNQAVVTTAFNAGATTAVAGGLTLYNPITSTKNVVIQSADAAFVVAQTNAAAIGIAVGFSPVTAVSGTLTTVPIQNAYPVTAANASAATLYSSASITLPATPTIVKLLGSVDTGALTTETVPNKIEAEIQGSIVLPPGGYATFTSSAAGTASSFIGSFSWVELPAGATA